MGLARRAEGEQQRARLSRLRTRMRGRSQKRSSRMRRRAISACTARRNVDASMKLATPSSSPTSPVDLLSLHLFLGLPKPPIAHTRLPSTILLDEARPVSPAAPPKPPSLRLKISPRPPHCPPSSLPLPSSLNLEPAPSTVSPPTPSPLSPLLPLPSLPSITPLCTKRTPPPPSLHLFRRLCRAGASNTLRPSTLPLVGRVAEPSRSGRTRTVRP